MKFKDLTENDKNIIRKITGEKEPIGFFCSRKDIEEPKFEPVKELTERQKLIKKLKDISK